MKETFKAALTGERNSELKDMLSYMISISKSIENINGKVVMHVDLMGFDIPTALGLATWDRNENCTALITHDLRSFSVYDLGTLIYKIRNEGETK